MALVLTVGVNRPLPSFVKEMIYIYRVLLPTNNTRYHQRKKTDKRRGIKKENKKINCQEHISIPEGKIPNIKLIKKGKKRTNEKYGFVSDRCLYP